MLQLVNEKELDEFIYGLHRGFIGQFKLCSVIQEGVSYKKSIPKKFWSDEDKACYGIFGMSHLSKDTVRQVREQVIKRIIQEINESFNREVYSDNFFRLLHALTLFEVPKDDLSVPAIGENYMYNLAYDLWAFDDGDQRTYELLANIAWYAAEAFKSQSFTSEELVTGRRHNFS